MVEFEENAAITPKVYSLDCKVGGNYWCTIIVINYDKCIFFVNNRVRKVWT